MIRLLFFRPFLLIGLTCRCSQLFLVVFDFFRVSTLFLVSGQIEERCFPSDDRRGPWTVTWRCSWTKDQSVARSCDRRRYRIHQFLLKRSWDEHTSKLWSFDKSRFPSRLVTWWISLSFSPKAGALFYMLYSHLRRCCNFLSKIYDKGLYECKQIKIAHPLGSNLQAVRRVRGIGLSVDQAKQCFIT